MCKLMCSWAVQPYSKLIKLVHTKDVVLDQVLIGRQHVDPCLFVVVSVLLTRHAMQAAAFELLGTAECLHDCIKVYLCYAAVTEDDGPRR